MTTKWKKLITEINKVEAKYGSVMNVPYTDNKAMFPIYEITNQNRLAIDKNRIQELTEIQYDALQRYMRKEIRITDVTRIIRKSGSWIKPRVAAIEVGRYMII